MAAGGLMAAAAQAMKVSGGVVRMKPDEFRKVLIRAAEPAVVIAQGGVFSTTYQYLTSYKGLVFFTKSKTPLDLPAGAEVIAADQIRMH